MRVPGPTIKCGTCSQYAVQVPGGQKRLGVVDTSSLGTNQPKAKAKPAGELTASSRRDLQAQDQRRGLAHDLVLILGPDPFGRGEIADRIVFAEWVIGSKNDAIGSDALD